MSGKTGEKERKQAAGQALPDAAQVAAFLRANPDFLQRYPELLDLQMPSGRHSGRSGVVDLQQFMVERLRSDVARLRANQEEIVTNSRDNLHTQERVHRAALALLEANSFEQFIETITGDLVDIVDVDVVSLCIEAQMLPPGKPRAGGIEILPKGTVDALFGPNGHALLRDDVIGDPTIFGAAAGLVRSDALLRLNVGGDVPAGLLGFGTRHPGYFHAGQGTELMAFLGRIVEFGIRAWLDLPKP